MDPIQQHCNNWLEQHCDNFKQLTQELEQLAQQVRRHSLDEVGLEEEKQLLEEKTKLWVVECMELNNFFHNEVIWAEGKTRQ